MRDLISANVAAITMYSPASSSCSSCMSSMYCMYWRVISASGMSSTSRFWRRMRYSSRSSGPSKASRNTSRACGGMYRSRGSCVTGSPLMTANGISTCSGGDTTTGGSGVLDTTIFSSGFIHDLATASLGAKMHRAAHFVQRLARGVVRIDLVQIPHRALLRVARIGASHPRRVGFHGAQLLHDRVRILAQPDGVAVGLGHLAPVGAGHLRGGGQQHLRFGQDGDPRALEESEQPLAVGHGDAVVTLD